MNKKAAVLIGIGAALGLGWLVRPFLFALFGGERGDKKRDIVLGTDANGDPYIKEPVKDVELKHNKHLTWWVINESEHNVVVSMINWRDDQHNRRPAAVDADPNDHDDPPQIDLSRKVPKGKKRPIRGKGRAPEGKSGEEDVYYDIFLDKKLGSDPIVKLVL